MVSSPLKSLWQASLGLLVPAVVLVVWQVVGSMPHMAGILPTPLQVVAGWNTWMFGTAGMGLNPYSGTWLSNVQYSSMLWRRALPWRRSWACPLGCSLGGVACSCTWSTP